MTTPNDTLAKPQALVDRDALHAVLSALNGPDHLIRELQATRGIEKLTGTSNPINQLIRDYNAPASIDAQAPAVGEPQDVMGKAMEQLASASRRSSSAKEWEALFWRVAKALKCLPSSFVDGNEHVIRAAEAAQQAVQASMGWLPIKTAPRDGTNILLRFGSDGDSQGKYIPGLPHPWQFIDTQNGISWLINHAVDGPGGPSHWMHFPVYIAAARPRPEGSNG